MTVELITGPGEIDTSALGQLGPNNAAMMQAQMSVSAVPNDNNKEVTDGFWIACDDALNEFLFVERVCRPNKKQVLQNQYVMINPRKKILYSEVAIPVQAGPGYVWVKAKLENGTLYSKAWVGTEPSGWMLTDPGVEMPGTGVTLTGTNQTSTTVTHLFDAVKFSPK